MLTDRGSEYCGNPERHEYELYLAIEDIDHSSDQDQEPANGMEFASASTRPCWTSSTASAFRKKLYRTDRRAAGRPGPTACSRSRGGPHPPGPMALRQERSTPQTFLDSLPMAREKLLDQQSQPVAVAC